MFFAKLHCLLQSYIIYCQVALFIAKLYYLLPSCIVYCLVTLFIAKLHCLLPSYIVYCQATLFIAMYCRAAAMTLRTVLLSLQALLAAAEPDDPQDAVVARQYKEFPEIFRQTAKHWANIYAGGKVHCFFLHHNSCNKMYDAVYTVKPIIIALLLISRISR